MAFKRANFSLRTLLLIFALAAIVFCILGGIYRQGIIQHANIMEIKKLGGFPGYVIGDLTYSPSESEKENNLQKFLRETFGDTYYGSVRTINLPNDIALIPTGVLCDFEELSHISIIKQTITPQTIYKISLVKQLKSLAFQLCNLDKSICQDLHLLNHLESIELTDPSLDDFVFESICQNVDMRELRLALVNFNEVNLAHIAKLESLESLVLRLCDLRVGDIKLIADNSNLQSLTLLEVDSFQDDHLEELNSMTSLKLLRVFGTKVTKDGIEKIKSATPGIRIETDVGY